MKCPNCGEECERDMVDVGVGEIPSGPWGCENCGWVEGSIETELDTMPFDLSLDINNPQEG